MKKLSIFILICLITSQFILPSLDAFANEPKGLQNYSNERNMEDERNIEDERNMEDERNIEDEVTYKQVVLIPNHESLIPNQNSSIYNGKNQNLIKLSSEKITPQLPATGSTSLFPLIGSILAGIGGLFVLKKI